MTTRTETAKQSGDVRTYPARAAELLQEFERDLDPAVPEQGPLGPRIIGYGEMSTVLTFGATDLGGHAFKRMPLFECEGEAEIYLKDYEAYGRALEGCGLQLPEWGALRVNGHSGRPVLYLYQRLLNPDRIAHRLIRSASPEAALHVFAAVLESAWMVLSRNSNELSLGLDAQLSNWAVEGDGDVRGVPRLVYVDTSTPLMRDHGRERLNTELFLRVCPSSLVWIVRRFFLQGVLDRYYDFRLVVLDCIANLHKEGRPELIPSFLAAGNAFLRVHGLGVITRKEVDAYYKEDAFIWRLFLSLRRLEQKWRRATGRRYELILPGPIRR